MGFPGDFTVENVPVSTGDMGSIPGVGTYSGGISGNPLQYSFLENPMDRRAWWAAVHGVAELDMTEQLSTQQALVWLQSSFVFPSDNDVELFFHMHIDNLYIFFGEVSTQVLCPFLKRVVCIFVVGWEEFFI